MIEETVLIDFATFSDADGIGEMSKRDIEYGLGWKYTPERVGTLINDESKNVVVARAAGKLVGFGVMTYYDDQANLDLLAVHESFRRMKIGTRIVRWLEQVAWTAGAFNIFVQVRAHNAGAIEFYERLGFSLLDEEKGYYGGVEAGLIMAKCLRLMFKASR